MVPNINLPLSRPPLYRYNAQKKYAEAIDLLYNGAITLLKHNQVFFAILKVIQVTLET